MSTPDVIPQLRPTTTRSVLGFCLMVAVLVCGGGRAAEATPFTVTYVLTLGLTNGPDTLGLDGATLTLTAGFDTTDTYINLFGLPAIVADSQSLEISGASVAATNGTYSSAFGVGFFPTYPGQWYDAAGGFLTYDLPGGELGFSYISLAVAGVNVGDLIDLSHFGTTLQGVSNTASGAGSDYLISSLEFSSQVDGTPVPEPASLTLLGLGLAGMAGRRWRQRKAL